MSKLAASVATSSPLDKGKKLKNNVGFVKATLLTGDCTEKKKKRSKQKTELAGADDENASVKPPKKEKKRKRKDENLEKLNTAVPAEPDIVDEPPRKKRKNRTEFSDPREDASLSGQTRNALEYAFTQLNKPKKWKFSKARQNWIIRNVPDSYFPLALSYLAKVQGGSRNKLKEIAQGHLKPKPSTLDTPAKIIESVTSPEFIELPPKAKKVTFGPLVNVAPKPGVLVDKPLVKETDTNKPDSEEIRRGRAQNVLKALEGSPD
ncbi:hypothetical protein CPB83DRAFT_888849 [Crepidotus variabilis]|uniref:WKF domain-containing protein n=1 Tax=Crepidotus variabilis TaxID=179855 RepID=A0A9P6ETS9_9AGAR|nr:hypothetical protein CPB83DRAFT_888849 [Crepidotus variabilis]